jgi:hypothetical protein
MQPGEVVATTATFFEQSVYFRLLDETLVTLWIGKKFFVQPSGFMVFTAEQNLRKGESLYDGDMAAFERLLQAAAAGLGEPADKGQHYGAALDKIGRYLAGCADPEGLRRCLAEHAG